MLAEQLVEQIDEHLRKGSRVRVVGHLVTSSWSDRESGQRRAKMVVLAETVLFLDTRPAIVEAEELVEEELPETLN